METARKHIKYLSIVILILAGLSLINVVTGLFVGMNDVEIPEGSPENVLLIAKIVVAVISAIILLPQVYVGVKGIKVANSPDGSKGHIFWAIVLLVISILSVFTPLRGLISLQNIFSNVIDLAYVLAEIVIFLEYIKSAKIIAKSK